MKNKLLSILLSLAMFVSMIPAMTLSVFAEETANIYFAATDHGKVAISVDGEDYSLANSTEQVVVGEDVKIRAISDYGYKLKSLTIVHDWVKLEKLNFTMPNATILVTAKFEKIAPEDKAALSDHTKMLLKRYSSLVDESQNLAVNAMSNWFADSANQYGVTYVEDLFVSNERYRKDLFYVSMLGLSASMNSFLYAGLEGNENIDCMSCVLDHFPPLKDIICGIFDGCQVCYGEGASPVNNDFERFGSYIKEFAAARGEMCVECIISGDVETGSLEGSKACFKYTKQYLTDNTSFGNPRNGSDTAYVNLAKTLANIVAVDNKAASFEKYARDYLDMAANHNMYDSIGIISEKEISKLSEKKLQEYFDKVLVGTVIAVFKSFEYIFTFEDYDKGSYFNMFKCVIDHAGPMEYKVKDIIENYNAYYTKTGVGKEDGLEGFKENTHYVIKDAIDLIHNATVLEINAWQELQEIINGTSDNSLVIGSHETDGVRIISLFSDVTAENGDTMLTVPQNKSIILNLNGYIIDAKEKCAAIWNSENSKLVIKDYRYRDSSFGPEGGYITGGKSDCGGAIINRGSLVLDSGIIDSCYATGSSYSGGGAVYNYNGADTDANFTMNGGTITLCNADVYGGAICNIKGKVVINDGIIDGCEVTNDDAKGNSAGLGAAIYSNNELTINGGTIKNCHSAYAGGAIFNDGRSDTLGKGLNTVFTMTGGEITNCRGTSSDSRPASEVVYLRNSKMLMSKNAEIHGDIYSNNQKTGTYIDPSQIKISGGKFNGEFVNKPGTSESAISITGGKFANDPTNFLTSGYKVNEISESPYLYQVVSNNPGGGTDPVDELEEVRTAANNKIIEIAGEVETRSSDVERLVADAALAIAAATTEDEIQGIQVMYANSIQTAIKVNALTADQNKAKAYKSGKIKISFKRLAINKNNYVAKYQIYKKQAGKSYKRLTTVTNSKNSKTITFTNKKGLKKNKKYSYKVRGVVALADGSYAYTKWSKVQTVKCKKTR